MARLIFISEKHLGRVYEFLVEKTTVGRNEQNTLTIADDSVSEVHCHILVNGPEVIVRDLGSANGTWVNGVCLRNAQRPLMHQQIVKFGSVEARLELENEDRGTATDVTAVHAFWRAVKDKPKS
jgi:pSer/pThr/pTyr-binding forkhead associated (FHA) protein